mmetsp:Transcript_59233/g.157296  ORF Transcript_59233/g.157296 Transcript_59233/m.157296 type:complete len:1464 (+) Transcript_59233:82-4473(+)
MRKFAVFIAIIVLAWKYTFLQTYQSQPTYRSHNAIPIEMSYNVSEHADHSVICRLASQKLHTELVHQFNNVAWRSTEIPAASLHVISALNVSSTNLGNMKRGFEISLGEKAFRRCVKIDSEVSEEWSIAVERLAPRKLSIECSPGSLLLAAAQWFANQPWVVWVEPGLGGAANRKNYKAQNNAAGRLILSGSSEASRLSDSPITSRVGLNGSGQVIAVADTGADFDQCMLWQHSFEFPCYDVYGSNNVGMCSQDRYAAFLASSDLVALVERFSLLETALDAQLITARDYSAALPVAAAANSELDSARTAVQAATLAASSTSAGFQEYADLQTAQARLSRATSSATSANLIVSNLGGQLQKLQNFVSFGQDKPLLDGGSAEGASAVRATADVAVPRLEARRLVYKRFSLSPATPTRLQSVLRLLRAWSIVRPQLLNALLEDDARADEAVLSNGETVTSAGRIEYQGGLLVYVESSSTSGSYSYSDSDPLAAAVVSTNAWRSLSRSMTEACFCYLASSNPATINSARVLDGPVPPVREILNMSTSSVAISRMRAGLTLIDPDILSALCNASLTASEATFASTTAANVANLTSSSSTDTSDGCDFVKFKWGSQNISLSPCSLTWEPRLMHSAISTCASANYVGKRAANISSQSVPQTQVAISSNYSLGIVEEWWTEYTRVPPVNRTDSSRRKIIAYFNYRKCREYVQLNTDTFRGVSQEDRVSATIGPSRRFRSLRLRPMNDSALDSFQARNIPHRAQIFVSIDIKIDINISQKIVVDASWKELFRIHVAAGECFMVAANSSGLAVPLSEVQMTTIGSASMQRIWLNSTAALPLSADGWCLFVNSSSNMDLGARIVANLLRVKSSCGDLSDEATEIPESLRSSRLRPLNMNLDVPGATSNSVLETNALNQTNNISSFTNSTSTSNANGASSFYGSEQDPLKVQFFENALSCALAAGVGLKTQATSTSASLNPAATYCDGTTWSGRQLDRCWVCGGGCQSDDCTASACPEVNDALVRVRFSGEFSQVPPGTVSKRYSSSMCPVVNGVSQSVGPYDCVQLECFGGKNCSARKETYKVDTNELRLRAGSTFVFAPGTLHIDYRTANTQTDGIEATTNIEAQFWSITLSSRVVFFSRPDENVPGGGFSLSSNGRSAYLNGKFPPVNGGELQIANGSTFANVTFRGNLTTFASILTGLSFKAPFNDDFGTSLDNRQVLLRFRMQRLRDDGLPFSSREIRSRNAIGVLFCPTAGLGEPGSGDDLRLCTCRPGWTGSSCDIITPDLEVRITIEPKDTSKEYLWASTSASNASIHHKGHGTHTAVTAAGSALLDQNDPQAGVDSSGNAAGAKWDSLAASAKLVIVDIGMSGYPYLTPPESFGDELLLPSYLAGARVFLMPWACQDASFGCDGYGASAWEVDDFVSRHPDLLVIMAAGEINDQGFDAVTAPATCRNCITVGTTQVVCRVVVTLMS